MAESTNPADAIWKIFSLADTRLWHYRAYIVRVIDGDTVVALIDKGFENIKREKLRLAGVDAPEVRPKRGTEEERTAEKAAAKIATDRVRELIEGKQVVIRTYKTGKFGRWLADIYLPGEPGRTINELLLTEGLAKEYPR